MYKKKASKVSVSKSVVLTSHACTVRQSSLVCLQDYRRIIWDDHRREHYAFL